MADPPVSGKIDATSFPHILVDLHRQGATGSLKVNGPVHPKALYFRAGRILFGSSNDPRDQLGSILIESGKITREQLDEVNEKVGPGNPLAKVLAESGFVNPRELGDAARVKVERILSDVLSWAAGTFEFEDGVLPKGAVDLKLSTGKLLLAAVQRIGDRAFALRHLGGDMTVVLQAEPDAEAALDDVRAEVWPLLERLDGERTLQDAVALTRLEEFDAAKMACALLFLGIVRQKDTTASDELDLAQEAMSGFGGQASAGASPGAAPSPTEPEPGPVIVPSESEEPMGVAPEEEPTGFSFVGADEATPPAEGVAPSPPSFAVEPPADEPAPLFNAEAPIEAPAPAEEPPMETAIPSFAVETPSREGVDTVPGDRPTFVPEAEPAPEIPVAESLPEVPASPQPASEPSAAAQPPAMLSQPSSPDSTARPTQEDLAALDALLDPSASGTKAPPAERPRAERWEPQFRASGPSGPNATTRRAVGRRSERSRAPLFAVLLTLVVVGVGGGYYFLRGSSPASAPGPASTPPTAAPTPALSAPVTVAAAPSPMASPTVSPAAAPTPAAAGTATAPPPAAATPTPAPTPSPTATPTAQPAPAPAPAGDALALLRQGRFDESAKAFASSLAARAQDSFSIQVLAACSPDTIRKAAQNVTGDEIFILPVTLNGRACYRVGWGVYDSRASAEAGARDLPSYFRQSGITPRIQPLVELLP